jgi:glycosyltransferase involved in cell wall biosynthesis
VRPPFRQKHFVLIGPYRGQRFEERYGSQSAGGLGGLRKMEGVLAALLSARARVTVVSTALNDISAPGWRPRQTEILTVEGEEVECVYPGTWQRKPFGGGLLLATAWQEGRRVAKSVPVDCVFSYNAQAAESSVWAGIQSVTRNAQLIVELDDLPDARNRGFNPKPLLDRLVVKRMLRRADNVIAVNASICRQMGYLEDPDLLLPGLISKDLVALRHRRLPPFSGPVRIAAYAGGLSRERGADRLLEAVPSLPPGWKLVVAGRGPLTPSFRNAASTSPERLEFLGSLPGSEMVNLYGRADVLINTPEELSKPDAVFPFKIFEYLVSGAAVVCPALPRNGVISTELIETWDGRSATLADALRREEIRWPQVRKDYESLANRLADEFCVPVVGRKIMKFLHSEASDE